MEVKVFGNEYQVDNKMTNTGILRSQFEEYANSATENIRNKYYEFGTMKRVVNELPQYGLELIKEYIDECMLIFSNNGLHNIDKDAFVEYTGTISAWAECCEIALYLPLQLQKNRKIQLYTIWEQSFSREMEKFPENQIGYSHDELTALKLYDTVTAQKFKFELSNDLEKMYNSPLVKDTFFEEIGKSF